MALESTALIMLGMQRDQFDPDAPTRGLIEDPDMVDRVHDALIAAAGLGDRVRPLIRHRGEHVFHQYIVRVEQRDALRQHLADQSIGSEVYYPIPLHLQECFTNLGYREGDFPVAERAAQQVLALPIYPGLPASSQERVIEAIAGFCKN